MTDTTIERLRNEKREILERARQHGYAEMSDDPEVSYEDLLAYAGGVEPEWLDGALDRFDGRLPDDEGREAVREGIQKRAEELLAEVDRAPAAKVA